MPELPDLTVYLEALEPRVLGQPLEKIRLASISLLRSVEPPLAAFEDKRVVALRRLGKGWCSASKRSCSWCCT
jgi:formamidopyrimidine-DNA glycosylase